MCRRPRHFFREDIQKASRHMKRCWRSLSMREMHIRTTVRHHLALIGMTTIKKPVSNKCWRGCGGKRSLAHYWRECKLVQLLWKTVWNFLKKKNKTRKWNYSMIQEFHSWVCIQTKQLTLFRKDTYTPCSNSSTIYNSQGAHQQMIGLRRYNMQKNITQP